MKLTTVPIRTARPLHADEPSPAFRKRSWQSVQRSLDPLGTPRPIRAFSTSFDGATSE